MNKELIEEVKAALERYRAMTTTIGDPKQSRLKKSFVGLCGLAQNLFVTTARDDGLLCYPFASQSLQDWRYGHAACVVQQADDLYIVDPTICQFEGTTLTATLRETDAGKLILNALLEDGFCLLTPEKANAYLSSFCEGKEEFKDHESAFNFLRRPPAHPFHMMTGPADNVFTKQELEKMGLLPLTKPIFVAPEARGPLLGTH